VVAAALEEAARMEKAAADRQIQRGLFRRALSAQHGAGTKTPSRMAQQEMAQTVCSLSLLRGRTPC
jgi:hypothetical protein